MCVIVALSKCASTMSEPLKSPPINVALVRFAFERFDPWAVTKVKFADVAVVPFRFARVKSVFLSFAELSVLLERFASVRSASVRLAPVMFAEAADTCLKLDPLKSAVLRLAVVNVASTS